MLKTKSQATRRTYCHSQESRRYNLTKVSHPDGIKRHAEKEVVVPDVCALHFVRSTIDFVILTAEVEILQLSSWLYAPETVLVSIVPCSRDAWPFIIEELYGQLP